MQSHVLYSMTGAAAAGALRRGAAGAGGGACGNAMESLAHLIVQFKIHLTPQALLRLTHSDAGLQALAAAAPDVVACILLALGELQLRKSCLQVRISWPRPQPTLRREQRVQNFSWPRFPSVLCIPYCCYTRTPPTRSLSRWGHDAMPDVARCRMPTALSNHSLCCWSRA